MWKLLGLAGGNTKKRGNKKSGESINSNPLQRHSHVLIFSLVVFPWWFSRPIASNLCRVMFNSLHTVHACISSIFWGTCKCFSIRIPFLSVQKYYIIQYNVQEHITEGTSNSTWVWNSYRSCVFLNAALPYKEHCLQKLHNITVSLWIWLCIQVCSVRSASAVQYAATLVCMEARKRPRLSQKELERIAG